jgi:hypothetical protein
MLILAILSSLRFCSSEGACVKQDESRPEPILFLTEAADAMEVYKKAHGEYAKAWHDLDISFANGPYMEGDPGTRPAQSSTVSWRPKGCDYTYWIVLADKTRFVVEARTPGNKAEYEITSGMRKPQRLPAAASAVNSSSKQIAEAVTFLNAALIAFQRYHQARGEYPSTWNSLQLNWVCNKGKGKSSSEAPSGVGPSWKPAGCHYSFKIIAANRNHFEIQSFNSEGLEDYAISSDQSAPTALVKK